MDPREWIILNQFSRRNLDSWDRADYGLTLEEILKEKAKKAREARKDGGKDSYLTHVSKNTGKADKIIGGKPEREWKGRRIHAREEAARKAGISTGSIYEAKVIKDQATHETIEELETGKTTIKAAFIKTTGKTPKAP